MLTFFLASAIIRKVVFSANYSLLTTYYLLFMLMLRFQRIGRRNDPAFRIVATEKRSKPKSGFLEILGSYHPKTKDTQLKNERILHWLSKGAQASETVHNLLVSKGVVQGKKIAVKMAKAAMQLTTDNQQPTTDIAETAKEPEVTKEPEATKEQEVKSEEVAAPAEEKKEEVAAI